MYEILYRLINVIYLQLLGQHSTAGEKLLNSIHSGNKPQRPLCVNNKFLINIKTTCCFKQNLAVDFFLINDERRLSTTSNCWGLP